MKNSLSVICLLCLCLNVPIRVHSQATELAQLALNIEKLAQFKQILSDMKKGYEVLTGGYNTIKDISEGNFKLHEVFLNGLSNVSPTVKKYKRIADIINDQLQLVKEYKVALKRFNTSEWFSKEELEYISGVYKTLLDESLGNLDDLVTVISDGVLLMDDNERLTNIDRIYEDMSNKLSFLRSFNAKTGMLALQRVRERIETERLRKMF
ncbi:MAG: TerB family tellurite resistance protein [Agriterribacter sp.]